MVYQFREVAIFGRNKRVDHYKQPCFAWQSMISGGKHLKKKGHHLENFMATEIPFVRDFDFEYGKIENLTP